MEEQQELPQGWSWVSIEELTTETMIGLVRSALEQNSAGNGVGYVKMNNINLNGQIDAAGLVGVQATTGEITRYSLRSGDVLFNTRNSVELVGKVGIFRAGTETVVFNNNLMRMRFVAGVSPDYIVQVFCSPSVRKRLDKIKRATTSIAAIYAKDFLPFVVPLPPLPEQRRIVAKLEELFSKLDAGVAAVRRTQALLKRYRQSVLHAAVTGELTRAWREAHSAPTETGAALLERIRAERRAQWGAAQVAKRGGQLPLGDGWKSKYVEPEAVDTEGLPELPEGWVWGSLDECLIQLRNGISTKPSESSGLRILRISAVRALQVKIEDVRYLTGTDEDYGDFLLKTGDLLFTRYNGNPDFVGVCGRVPDLPETTVYPDKLIRGRVVIDMSSFLQTVLNTGASREYIRVRIKTTAGQAGIAGSDLKSVPVPLPPLAEQVEIVAGVERRLTVLDALSHTLTDELKRAERLRQSILHRAFTGRLVPQDATDEPAAALLARLRETPAAPAKTKVGRGHKAVAQQTTLGL